MAIKEIHQGKLVPLLKQAPDVHFDVHAVWQQTPHLPLRVRIAVDTLASRLPSVLSQDMPAPIKSRAKRAASYRAVSRRLNIDICRFQGVLFDEGTTWFNRIAHQGREQLVCSNRVFNGHAQHATAFRIHGGFPQLLRVHFAQTFIALDREAATGLFHQPVQRLLEAGYRLTTFATFDERIVFDQAAQLLAERADTTVFRTGDKLVLQRIVGVDAVGTYANDRLELPVSVLLNIAFPLAAVLLFLVQIGHPGRSPSG